MPLDLKQANAEGVRHGCFIEMSDGTVSTGGIDRENLLCVRSTPSSKSGSGSGAAAAASWSRSWERPVTIAGIPTRANRRLRSPCCRRDNGLTRERSPYVVGTRCLAGFIYCRSATNVPAYLLLGGTDTPSSSSCAEREFEFHGRYR